MIAEATLSSQAPELEAPFLDIFIDYACPWCCFQARAVALVAQQRPMPVRWRSFILRPDVPVEGEDFDARDLVDKNPPIYGEMAQALGLPWPGNRRRRFRTQAAHVLMKVAERQGRIAAFHAAVFAAYFVAQRNVAQRAVLEEILAASGVTADLDAVLNVAAPEVRRVEADLAAAYELGISGVPTIVVAGRPIANFLRPQQLAMLMDRLDA